MIDEVDSDRMARITMIHWTLWWRRNQRCWNDKTPTILEVIRRAGDTYQNWLQVQARTMNTDHVRAARVSYCWSKPVAGKLECNVDTAYCKEALRWLWNNYREAADIKVESDCLQVVQAINYTHNNNTEFGSMIVLCRNLLALNKNCK
ncbi:hypothetical protein A2U01_0029999, partial [Trifolium medium]|nr:hypothetical protein [Trifolium medium]